MKKDLKVFKRIEKYFNTVKILKNYMWNLKRVKEKKQYIKYFYIATYTIIQNNNYIHNHLTLFDKKFFYHLKHYGEKV